MQCSCTAVTELHVCIRIYVCLCLCKYNQVLMLTLFRDCSCSSPTDKENWRSHHENGVKKKKKIYEQQNYQSLVPPQICFSHVLHSQSKKFHPISPEFSVLLTISRDMGSTAPHSITTQSCAEPPNKLSVHTRHFTDQKFPPSPTKFLRTYQLWYLHSLSENEQKTSKDNRRH